MKVYIGSDHAGFTAKDEVKSILSDLGIEFEDLGTNTEESVDYPLIAKPVCEKVLSDSGSFGLLICGSGDGMAIAANKIDGIRADLCYDVYSAKMARFDNDANVLTLRSREFDHSLYPDIVKTFLETEFSGEERHKRRIEELKKLEDEN